MNAIILTLILTPIVYIALRFLERWGESLIEYDVKRYERKGKK